MIAKFSTDDRQTNRNTSTPQFRWLVADTIWNNLTHSIWANVPTLDIRDRRLSIARLGCEGVEIFLSVCRSSVKKLFSSKAWRRIIQFGLSATSATKGGRRNIPFGLPIVRRKLQHSTFPNTGMRGKDDITSQLTIRRITRRKLENDSKSLASNYSVWFFCQ